ncbi:hypothetical protein CIB48_g5570 [Xylaria polymorpha]|nr:hypothetical protein CIB48_g5570 [Xylaria polymorpha]
MLSDEGPRSGYIIGPDSMTSRQVAAQGPRVTAMQFVATVPSGPFFDRNQKWHLQGIVLAPDSSLLGVLDPMPVSAKLVAGTGSVPNRQASGIVEI